MKGKPEGLYSKYKVISNETGKELDTPCFVLRPDRDPVAFTALKAYANHTDNKQLSLEIMRWLLNLKEEELSNTVPRLPRPPKRVRIDDTYPEDIKEPEGSYPNE